jgi:hypothetical protein
VIGTKTNKKYPNGCDQQRSAQEPQALTSTAPGPMPIEQGKRYRYFAQAFDRLGMQRTFLQQQFYVVLLLGR